MLTYTGGGMSSTRTKRTVSIAVVKLWLAIAGLLFAQQTPSTPKISDDFVIGVDDILNIQVWRSPDHSAPHSVVRPDGKITLPLIKDVQAAGLTTKQLEESIVQQFSGVLKEPIVIITVLKIESRKVSVGGNIAKPGAYPFGEPLTVLELIIRAGGPTEYAKGGGKAIKILRKKDGSTIDFNYQEVLQGKNLRQNILLENGDIVMVR
jgi:polysaccharide biosynthesis/export protein